MKLIKNVLIGLGVFFLIIVLLIAFITGKSVNFKEEHEAFVKEFSFQLSKSWELDQLANFMTNEMLSLSSSDKAIQAMAYFESLGELQEITDLELINYNAKSGTENFTTGIFRYKGKFKNGIGLVTVTLIVKDNEVKVHGFRIDPIGDIELKSKVKA